MLFRAPSNRIPSVAANYSGTTSITFPELGQFVTCPTTASVTQSGSTVTIASLEVRGECGTVSIPVGSITIDATGSLRPFALVFGAIGLSKA